MPDSCASHNRYGESLKWSFTAPLGTCVYDIFDQMSFIIGWISVLTWSVALLPQIITNFKKKSAESQSFWFWILWTVGDVCNFTGTIMTKNLITNIALAAVYLLLTCVACTQVLYYEYILKKYHLKQKLILNINNTPNTPNTPTFSYPLSLSSIMYNTSNFTKYGTLPITDMHMSTQLRSTLAILSRSPRMFTISPQLTPELRHEYESIQQQTIAAQRSMHSLRSEEHKSHSIPIANPTKLTHTTTATANTGHGSYRTTVIGTLSSMTVTVVMLYGLQYDGDPVMYANYPTSNRILLNSNSNSYASTVMMVGITIGWIASFIYIASRIPQLHLMFKTKAVSGINPLFFGLTFLGNLTQCLSMLVKKDMYADTSDFLSKLPWLVTAGCCMLQDGVILFLIFLYRTNVTKKEKLLDKS